MKSHKCPNDPKKKIIILLPLSKYLQTRQFHQNRGNSYRIIASLTDRYTICKIVHGPSEVRSVIIIKGIVHCCHSATDHAILNTLGNYEDKRHQRSIGHCLEKTKIATRTVSQ